MFTVAAPTTRHPVSAFMTNVTTQTTPSTTKVVAQTTPSTTKVVAQTTPSTTKVSTAVDSDNDHGHSDIIRSKSTVT